MTDGVDPAVLAEAMDAWTAGIWKCRGRGRHNWNPYTSFVGPFVIDVHEECGNCRARRHRHMHGNSSRTPGRWIDPKWRPERWPDDYVLPKGSGRLSPEQKELIRFKEFMMRGRIVEVAE